MATKVSEDGFSLIEAVVAAGIVAGALAALAQMLAMSIANNASARSGSAAMVLAGQKMEQLRARRWDDYSPGGSPGETLSGNVAGYVDYVDQWGHILGEGATMPAGTMYIRRWSVVPLPASPGALVLQVLVARPGRDDAARLVSVRSRKMP